MSNRQRNHKRNKHLVSYWWRGDVEDEEFYQFPTKEDTWAFVLGKIRKTVKAFEKEGPSEIDFEKVKAELFSKGMVQVQYARNSAWWHTFQYDDYTKEAK